MYKNAASGYFSTFRALLKKAYKEKLLTENVNDFLEYIEWDDVVKEFLNQDELIRLAQTPCDSDVLRRASLFSCLTGLRFSDILNLDWKNIQEIAGIGLCVVIKTQKTKTAATLPLCEDAIELIGERKTGKVFPGFKKTLTTKPLRDWIKVANIDKHITFHCLRHSDFSFLLRYSTLQNLAV